MKPPRVIILVLNYNLTDYTVECVRSLQGVSYESLEILIVDNGSTDQTPESLKKALPGIEVHSTGVNLGYTGGVNAGLKIALERDPDYILVLNPDTIVDKDFLGHLVSAMEEHPSAAGACGTIYTHHDRSLVWYAGGRMVPLRGIAVHENMGRHLDPSTLGVPRTVSFITGCMILFRPSALRVTGLEDERFFMALDDIEFSARMEKCGFQLLYVPQSVIYHKVFGEKESPFKVYYSVRNRMLLIRTAWNGAVGFIARMYFLVVISMKLPVWWLAKPPMFRAAWMGLVDYFQGNFGRGRGVEAFRYREDL